jgi:hypothetical protein
MLQLIDLVTFWRLPNVKIARTPFQPNHCPGAFPELLLTARLLRVVAQVARAMPEIRMGHISLSLVRNKLMTAHISHVIISWPP